MTGCLPILFHSFSYTRSPSASRGFQTLIILLFYPNGNCPSSAPMINKLNLKVDQHSHCRAQKQRYSCTQVSCACKCTRRACICRQTKNSIKRWQFQLLVIDHFHAAVLLNPKLTNNDIVDTTGGVCPGVGFIISAETKKQKSEDKKVT